jgi:hypothetical protein
MIDKFAIGISVFFGFTCFMLTIYDQTIFFASFYQFPMFNVLCVLEKRKQHKKKLKWKPHHKSIW